MNKELRQKWLLSPKGRYAHQKNDAKFRAIPWEITFDEWWSVWQESGHWEKRGRYGDDYCMCRTNDLGPYSAMNVRIDTHRNNLKESHGTGGKSRALPKV